MRAPGAHQYYLAPHTSSVAPKYLYHNYPTSAIVGYEPKHTLQVRAYYARHNTTRPRHHTTLAPPNPRQAPGSGLHGAPAPPTWGRHWPPQTQAMWLRGWPMTQEVQQSPLCLPTWEDPTLCWLSVWTSQRRLAPQNTLRVSLRLVGPLAKKRLFFYI